MESLRLADESLDIAETAIRSARARLAEHRTKYEERMNVPG